MKFVKYALSFSSVTVRNHHSSLKNRIGPSFTSFRKMATSLYWSNPQEVKIPTSYGFIAAKAWGDSQAMPILALHGWQDNAGTFDRLIPLLSTKAYIVAIDAPGHGFSSHKPHGTFYHYMEMLVDIKRIVDYLKWDSFSILGHSLGGTLALLYCSVFPENVSNLILLDIIKPASRTPDKLPDVTRTGIENLLQIEKKLSAQAPVYSVQEAKKRLISGMFNEITDESADILLKRGSKLSNCGKGVVFSRDIRVKMTEDLQKFSHEDLMAYMKRVQCNTLIIIGKKSIIFKSRTPEVLDDFINLYKQNCKSFKMVEVDGNHFVHLNNPELVAPHINEFLATQVNVSKI
ncbi:probable serine hydrolase [Uloborus diversus]|uniref:probable serine hydrolase n=1 Tax=Uloborus diversus TaxID=327109 RepID=UPI0024098020|nr:probable serine hydrolase [Uloborus diversus]